MRLSPERRLRGGEADLSVRALRSGQWPPRDLYDRLFAPRVGDSGFELVGDVILDPSVAAGFANQSRNVSNHHNAEL